MARLGHAHASTIFCAVIAARPPPIWARRLRRWHSRRGRGRRGCGRHERGRSLALGEGGEAMRAREPVPYIPLPRGSRGAVAAPTHATMSRQMHILATTTKRLSRALPCWRSRARPHGVDAWHAALDRALRRGTVAAAMRANPYVPHATLLCLRVVGSLRERGFERVVLADPVTDNKAVRDYG